MGVRKHFGPIACISRAVLAGCIYWMGYGERAPNWIVLMVLNIIASCVARSIIKYKKAKVTVNGEELSPKEGRNCSRKAYIYIAMVAGNIMWIVGFAVFALRINIYLAFNGNFWIAPLIVGICLILDIAFIKPKNLKYACVSYRETEHHSKSNSNNYHQVHGGVIIVDQEAQFLQQQQPGMMLV